MVLPPDHPLADAPVFPTEALAREPYVQLQGNARPSEMEALFEANGVTPNVRFTVDSDYGVMAMVSAGLGFSVLPSLILSRPLFPLAALATERECAREISLAVRSWETASAATHAFVETAQAWVAERYPA